MKKAFEKAGTKKISINVNKKTLEMVDGLAEIPGITRTQMIEALISSGFMYQIEYFEKVWGEFLEDKGYNDRKKLIEKLLNNLKKFKDKWNVERISLPY